MPTSSLPSTLPARSVWTIRPDSSLSTSRSLASASPASIGRLDKANTSAMSASPSRAGLNRLSGLAVLAEAVLAVPAAKSTVVWNRPCGDFSLATMKPPVSGSRVKPSMPVLPIVVPSLTVCVPAAPWVVPAV